MNENQEPVFEIYEDGKLTKTLTPIEKGLFREKQFCYVFNRVALNPMTMKNVQAAFIQIVLYKPKNREDFDYFWFYWEKGMMPHVKCIDSRLGRFAGYCSAPTITDENFVRKVGSPKRLSREQAQRILKNGTYENLPCLGIFGEDGAEGVAAKPV